MNNYFVRFIDLPCRIPGITIEDGTGFYNIYINSRLSFAEQQKAIRHELVHVLRDDFDASRKLEEIEPYRRKHVI